MKPLLLRTFTLSIVYASLAMRQQATDSVRPIAAKLNKILGMLMYSIREHSSMAPSRGASHWSWEI